MFKQVRMAPLGPIISETDNEVNTKFVCFHDILVLDWVPDVNIGREIDL